MKIKAFCEIVLFLYLTGLTEYGFMVVTVLKMDYLMFKTFKEKLCL